MRASSSLMREAVTSHVACRDRRALRIRVRKSEMGSVILESPVRWRGASPGRLHDAGEHPLQREAAEADAAEAETSQVRPRATAALATRVLPDRELRGPLGFRDHRLPGHGSVSLVAARERDTELLQEEERVIVTPCCGHDRDV